MSSLDKATQGQMGDDTYKSEKAEHIDLVDDIEKAGMADTITDVATSVDNIPISWFVWLVAATASMAGLLFGYDTGIISAALVYLNDDLNNRPVTSNEKELITSLCSGGAFFGAIFAGNTADRVRFPLLLWSDTRYFELTTSHSSVVKWPSTSAASFSSSVPSSKVQHTQLSRCRSDAALSALELGRQLWFARYMWLRLLPPEPVESSSD